MSRKFLYIRQPSSALALLSPPAIAAAIHRTTEQLQVDFQQVLPHELQEEIIKQWRLSEASQLAEELAIMAGHSSRRRPSGQGCSEGTDASADSASVESARQQKCAVNTWTSLKGMSKAYKLEVICSAVAISPISARAEQDMSKAFKVQSKLLTENS